MANFITRLINIMMAFFGWFVIEYFLHASILFPLDGIELTRIVIYQIAHTFFNPTIR